MAALKVFPFCLFCLANLSSAAEPWTTTPQPDLARQIEKAPDLRVENVSQPTRTVRNESPRIVPNAEGAPDVLVVYYKGYQGPGTVFALDASTGEVTRSEIPRGRNCHVQGTGLAKNGKLYQTLQLVGGGLELWIYDPKTNRFSAKEVFGREDLHLFGQGNRISPGIDGNFYGTVGSKTKGEAAFYQINPDDDSVKILGTGGSIKGSPYAGSLTQSKNGRLYAVYGKTPYRLIEFDPETKIARELATANPRGGFRISSGANGEFQVSINHPESGVETDGLYAIAENGMLRRIGGTTITATKDPASEKKGVKKREEGQSGKKASLKLQYVALLKEGLSPREAKAKVLGAKAPQNNRAQLKKMKTGGGTVRRSGSVDLDTSKIDPSQNDDQKGRLRYRISGENEWKTAVFDPPLYSEALVQLTTLPDGRVFGTSTNRAGHFIHDPASDKTIFLGRTGLQHHCSAVSGDRIYLSGYPSSTLWSYEFSGTNWTEPIPTKLGAGQFASTPASDNPRRLGALREFSGVHMATCAATDNSGRVYFAGRWYRDGNGGGLGWWDPKSQKPGGFWKSLSSLQVSDCCATRNGRFIVLSTLTVKDKVLDQETPKSASLCVIDTESDPNKIAKQIIPIPENTATGLIAPAGKNRIIGIAPSPDDEGTWILYGVEIETGKVAFTKELPGIPEGKISSREILHSYRNGLVVSPNTGDIWMKHLGVFLCIDPETARVRVVGRPVLGPEAKEGFNTLSEDDQKFLRSLKMLKADGAPATIGRFAISGKDLYLAGTPWLRRIKEIAE